MDEMSPHELKEILSESPETLSDLVKGVAHVHRLEVLALLLDGPKEFSSLLDVVKVSKTALANHVTHMMNKGFVERSERGMYQITAEGQSLLTAVATFYKDSKARELNRITQVKNQYAQGYKIMEEVTENLVANPPVIQDAWLTYVGAVTGVLQWLGVECDVTGVGGYSGYVFLINVAKGMTCPSGPTAHGAWREIHKGTESLGWKLKIFADERPFPLSEEVTPEDRDRAWKFFELVKKEIDEKGNPVVVWGIPVPEYGIVTGYRGDSYVASTVRRFTGKPEIPIRYDALQSPGCMEALFFVEEIPVSEQGDKEAIERALKMAEGAFTAKGYVTGPSAYNEWASVLETGEPGKVDYFGTSYVGACIDDARGIAVQFLERMSKKYENRPQATFLGRAAEEYTEVKKLLAEFVNIFPLFAHTGEMLPEACNKGAEILRTATHHEIAAIDYLRTAFQEWQ